MENITEEHYFTAEGVEITERIKEGLTFLFKNEKDANKKADEIRSYKYRVYDKSGNSAGFAVPK
ncbi:hypothetical protein CMU86_11755 [Elizabethkingia anophelis]|uniref:hypothetical protein n=1 Tax=Elizabethkingia anophelis TaxID=1117645 RepID=UPI002010DDF6|nr:hypothetical protein [Elizabethkingia anophelis]MCL1646550.1 hypothetical protein [Elizabethkingia anophelis]MDV3603832.1 hypothetical protein [Elizabethkingia anophelis]